MPTPIGTTRRGRIGVAANGGGIATWAAPMGTGGSRETALITIPSRVEYGKAASLIERFILANITSLEERIRKHTKESDAPRTGSSEDRLETLKSNFGTSRLTNF